MTFSNTVLWGNKLKFWNTIPIFWRNSLKFIFLCVNSFPSKITFPFDGVSNKFIHLNNVLLPLPDGPIIATTSPLLISKFISLSTSFLLNDLFKFWTLITGFHSPFD